MKKFSCTYYKGCGRDAITFHRPFPRPTGFNDMYFARCEKHPFELESNNIKISEEEYAIMKELCHICEDSATRFYFDGYLRGRFICYCDAHDRDKEYYIKRYGLISLTKEEYIIS